MSPLSAPATPSLPPSPPESCANSPPSTARSYSPSHWRLSAYPCPTRSSLASNPASCSLHRSNNIATPPARRILAYSYIRCTSERTNTFCSSPAYSRTAYRWHLATRAGAPKFITRLLNTRYELRPPPGTCLHFRILRNSPRADEFDYDFFFLPASYPNGQTR